MNIFTREAPVKGSVVVLTAEYAGRILFSAIFLSAGIGKLVDNVALQQLMEAHGVPGFFIWPAALVDFGCVIALVLGISLRLVAPLAALYVILLGIIFHFKPDSANDMIHFTKNLSIAGGLILLGLRSRTRYSGE